MKKILLSIISICAIFCGVISCQKEVRPADLSKDSQFVESGIEYTITAGAPFETKADDSEFVTVTGRSEFQVATLVCENIEYSNGTVVCNQYAENGEYLATLVFQGDTILDIELSDYVTEFDDYETRAKDPDSEEKFGECVKRMYKELKQELVEQSQVSCELSPSAAICSAVAEVAAIVKCL